MWKRDRPRPPRDPRATTPGLGVGVQVYVVEQEPPSSDDWPGEPTGVIIANGERTMRSISLPNDGFTHWIVAFSEPQLRRDGSGPYETASIPAALLVAAEPAEA